MTMDHKRASISPSFTIMPNLTITEAPPQWNSEPAFTLPSWGEPLIILVILLTSMFVTRRRNFQILQKKGDSYQIGILDDSDSARSSSELLRANAADDEDWQDYPATTKHLPKHRRCCGMLLLTPNSSRFSNHLHSRILQKFPFLVEMFYWIVTYQFYRLTKILSEHIFSESVWDVAQQNGLAVLQFEQFSWLSFLFPYKELDVQQWFMNGHQTALTVLNRAYALIHIPGTAGFIAWYYYVAPNHKLFASVRRTLTLTNLFAFITFTFYPCMPPRLLPPSYGFLDSVHHANASSVWMSGKFVNALAAMPSMHFGYAFVIGCTMIYHSAVFPRKLEKGEMKKSWLSKGIYILIGVGYPLFILVTIVATANHYWLDALVATIAASFAYLGNEFFLALLPIEDLLLWVIRAEKPVPTTGDRLKKRDGRF